MFALNAAQHTFADARDAIDALSVFEAETAEDYQYEVIPAFEYVLDADFDKVRELRGYQVRVKNLNNYSLGYVAPSNP